MRVVIGQNRDSVIGHHDHIASHWLTINVFQEMHVNPEIISYPEVNHVDGCGSRQHFYSSMRLWS